MPSVVNGLENQLRRPNRGRERNHLHRVLSGKVGRQLTDQQLREILQKSPSEGDYIGRITNVDYVSQFVSNALYPLPKGKPIDAAESPAYLEENAYVGSVRH